MPRILARLLAALAALLLLTVAATSAAAGDRATLRVSAQVVERCTVGVPGRVPPGLARRAWPEAVAHACSGPSVPVLRAVPLADVLPLAPELPARVTRRLSADAVVVTVTF